MEKQYRYDFYVNKQDVKELLKKGVMKSQILNTSASTATTNNISFSNDISPPTTDTLMNKCMYLEYELQFVITDVASAVAPNDGDKIFNNSSDFSLRPMFLNRAITSSNLTVNGQTITSNPSDIIEDYIDYQMLKSYDYGYSSVKNDRLYDLSTSPSYTLAQNSSSILDSFGDNYSRYVVLQSINQTARAGGGATQATTTITFLVREPVVHNFLNFQGDDSFCLYNISSMRLNLTLDSTVLKNGLQYFRNDNLNYNTMVAVSFVGDVNLVQQFYTVDDEFKKLMLPSQLENAQYFYNKHYRQAINTAITATTFNLTSNVSLNSVSQLGLNRINLASIPSVMYVGVRRKNNNLTASRALLHLPIKKLRIDIGNITNMLSTYNQKDLYELSRKNGLQKSWEEFRGYTIEIKNKVESAVSLNSSSIKILSTDLDLPPELAAGVQANVSMNIYVDFENNTTDSFNTSDIELYCVYECKNRVLLREGFCEITEGYVSSSEALNSVIVKNDGCCNDEVDVKAVNKLSGGINVGGLEVGGAAMTSRELMKMQRFRT